MRTEMSGVDWSTEDRRITGVDHVVQEVKPRGRWREAERYVSEGAIERATIDLFALATDDLARQGLRLVAVEWGDAVLQPGMVRLRFSDRTEYGDPEPGLCPDPDNCAANGHCGDQEFQR